MEHTIENGCLTIFFEGKIISSNAPEFSKDIMELVKQLRPTSVVLDATSLEFISSAGLRAVANLANTIEDITLRGASPDVHEVFYLTGLDQIVHVED